MATGANVRKTSFDVTSINKTTFDSLIKEKDGKLFVSDSINGDQELVIDTSNINVQAQAWNTYNKIPVAPVTNPYSFVNPENINKENNKWMIRVLLNGLELDYNEVIVSNADKRTITLDLENNLTIDNTDELKVWYVKEQE
jgi:hypothetical protein